MRYDLYKRMPYICGASNPSMLMLQLVASTNCRVVLLGYFIIVTVIPGFHIYSQLVVSENRIRLALIMSLQYMNLQRSNVPLLKSCYQSQCPYPS